MSRKLRPLALILTGALTLVALIALRNSETLTGGSDALLARSAQASLTFEPLESVPACVHSGAIPSRTTLGEVLQQEGVPDGEAREFLSHLATLVDMRRIRPNDEYRLLKDDRGNLVRFEFQPEDAAFYVVEKGETGLRAWRENEPVQRVYRKASGTVDGSLYMSMIEAGISPGLVATFCDVFSYDVDFATETKKGDRYEVLLEERLKDGQPIGGGRILSGKYRNGDKDFEAFYYEKKDGRGSYYHANGESLRRAFLKSPLNYTRISSGFTYKRRHPIFKTVRPHLGVDYAAPTGTPVVSVADGVVQYSGWINGYGNIVKVKHNNGLVTFYAHLSRFGKGARRGARVDQNQVIGYVGSTGHSTGPHLDFRIQQNGTFINPLTFKSTGGEPLDKSERADFAGVTSGYRDLMASLIEGTSLSEDQFAAVMSPQDPETPAQPH